MLPIGALLLAAMTAGSVRASAAAPEIGVILRECRRFAEAMSRSSGRFTITVEDERPEGPITRWVAREGSWVLSGERFREDSVTIFPPRESASRTDEPPVRAPQAGQGRQEPRRVWREGDWRRVVVFDGKRGVADTYNDSGAHVARDRFGGADARAHAIGACCFAEWLGLVDAAGPASVPAPIPMPEDKPTVIGGEAVSGVACVKVASSVPRGDWWHVWWVAPDYDYLVMRVDAIQRGPREGRLLEGESLIRRRRVSRVAHLEGGIHLPLAAEKVAAKVGSDGNVVRVYRRERFTASGITVDFAVSGDEFQLPSIPGVSTSLSEPDADSSGCAYDATLSFSAIMAADPGAIDFEGLTAMYEDRPQATFADIAADLESILEVPLAGYAGTLADVAVLDRPVIAHIQQADGTGHFVVIESLTCQNARIFDNQVMRIVGIEELSQHFTGAFLVVDHEGPARGPSTSPRLVCEQPIASAISAQVRSANPRWVFRLANVGTTTAEIHGHRLYPPDAPLDVSFPSTIEAGGLADVVVAAQQGSVALPWAACLWTNDPFRPTLWVGSVGPPSKEGHSHARDEKAE